jgi:magnesium-transporting ATPase (P-type)
MSASPVEDSDAADDPSLSRSSTRSEIGPLSNALLYLAFCLLAATGLAMTFRLDDRTSVMLGLDKQGWARIHAITALSVLSLVLLHLWLNWGWLRAMVRRLRWPTLMIALVGLAMIALALLAPSH